jgi:hypothetical protein
MTLFENEFVEKLAEDRLNPSAKFLIIGWINNDGGILGANVDELSAPTVSWFVVISRQIGCMRRPMLLSYFMRDNQCTCPIALR